MKKTLFILLTIICISPHINAQTNDTTATAIAKHKNEFIISYGILGAQDILSLVYSFNTFFYDPLIFEINNLNQTSGIFGITYGRFLSPKVKISGLLNFERARFTVQDEFGVVEGNDFNLDFYTFMVRGDWFYFTQEYVSLYSGLAIGGTIISSKNNSKYNAQNKNIGLFGFQINAIGLRLGYRFYALGELGFGYQGILRFGLGYRF
ncbi:MAG: hypothetical protein ACEPOW_06035 [Bacteroidales bacterium]